MRQREQGEGGSAPTRERAMAVAEAHLLRRGYRAVSLQEVAREVGVTKPSL
ncbi:TetR family transcriptional regulator [Phytoactinopolyspora halophila]|uniref:TetR family transcriptional regulator n=1 Tax=Phytoactinopolyspora halophila TaxID=1981511 RepID=UPI001B8DA5CD|nr:TetR family transcriptional regulator [Phytoactinopolyspora halophila]